MAGHRASRTGLRLTASATPLLPNSTSISSNVNRFVSGTKNQMKAPPAKVKSPKKMKVPKVIFFSITGVIWPTIKFDIQFEDAPRAMP